MRFVPGCVLATVCAVAWADEITGRVVGVTDGETIRVFDSRREPNAVAPGDFRKG